MIIQNASSIDRQQTPPTATEFNKEVSNVALSPGHLRGALATGTVLIVLWAGFHWNDPTSWTVGLTMALTGGALTLFLPASALLRLSPLGEPRFAKSAILRILRGPVDVSRRRHSGLGAHPPAQE